MTRRKEEKDYSFSLMFLSCGRGGGVKKGDREGERESVKVRKRERVKESGRRGNSS